MVSGLAVSFLVFKYSTYKLFVALPHAHIDTVEVVGYAFTDGNSDEDDADANNNNNKNSGSGSNSGSKDEQREGYWIVKNQWSNYWGMSGYAYLAMGDNTCGILNDMTQVYM